MELVNSNGYLPDRAFRWDGALGFDVDAAYHRLRHRLSRFGIAKGALVARIRNAGYHLLVPATVVSELTIPTIVDSDGQPQNLLLHDVTDLRVARLTSKEKEILFQMGKPENVGLTFRGLASLVNIKYKTINRYLRTIYSELGVGSKGEAILLSHQLFHAHSERRKQDE